MSDVSKLKPNGASGEEYNVKDAVARWQLQSTQTISGNPITLTDCAPINAESLVVELEPKQDLHGQSAPYVGGAGKNKLPMTVDGIKALNANGTWSGNTYTVGNATFTIETDTDGNVTGIKVNGGNSSNTSFFLTSGNLSAYGGMILNGTPNTVEGAYMCAELQDSPWTSYAADYGSGSEISNDIGAGTWIFIRIYAGSSISNVMFYPMIRLSTETDPTFAPYSNICPITGYTECEVESVGKNLFNPETVGVGYINDADGAVYTTQPSNHSDYIEVKPNTYYCMTTPQTSGLWGAWYDDNKNYISGVTLYNQGKKQAPNNAKYLRITVNYNNNNTDYANNVMVEEGENHTTYEPYHSSNATIQFGQTVYGGKVDFKTGVVTVDRALEVFDGSDDEGWSGTNSNKSRGTSKLQSVIKRASSDGVAVDFIKSNMFKKGTASEGWAGAPGVIGVGENGALYTSTGAVMSISDWTTYLVNNNLQICYELATPFTIQLTPDELKLLKGTNNITTNGTTINLGYQPDNVIGEVKGEIEQHLEMPYLRILDNDVDTEIKNYRLYYKFISSAYTLVNLEEMLRHRFLFVEVIRNPSGTANHELLHSALIDPRTIDGFEYGIDAGSGDTICIQSIIAENKFELDVRYTGSHTSGDPTDYYVTIRMVD